jgi:hypothetical protein
MFRKIVAWFGFTKIEAEEDTASTHEVRQFRPNTMTGNYSRVGSVRHEM